MHNVASLIKSAGSVSMADFMALSISCESGYYQKRDRFTSDFATSPEITSLFGYAIGSHILDVYKKCFSGRKARIIELGPGSGIMMNDILHIIKQDRVAYSSIDVAMVEISKTLQSRQQETLSGHDNISWHTSMPYTEDKPIFLVANEFFDALPLYQYTLMEGRLHERRVAFCNDGLHLVLDGRTICPYPPPQNMPEGGILERSPASLAIMRLIAQDIERCGGLGVFFDYGYIKSKYVDTIRAIKEHKIVDIFTEDADISADVDFGSLAAAIKSESRATTSKVYSQGNILRKFGLNNEVARTPSTPELKFAYDQIMHKMSRRFKALYVANYKNSSS